MPSSPGTVRKLALCLGGPAASGLLFPGITCSYFGSALLISLFALLHVQHLYIYILIIIYYVLRQNSKTILKTLNFPIIINQTACEKPYRLFQNPLSRESL
jgi:hypothetical protein